MTTNEKLIAILERAEHSAMNAHSTPPSEWRTMYGYAEDAQEQIGKALQILRELEAEAERDISKQAGAWGL